MSVFPQQYGAGLASPVRAPLVSSQVLPSVGAAPLNYGYGAPSTFGVPTAAPLVGGAYGVSGAAPLVGGAYGVSGASVLGGSRLGYAPQAYGAQTFAAQSYAAPQVFAAPVQVAAPVVTSQVVAAPQVVTAAAPAMRQSYKGESYFEYVPFEKTYYEQVPQTRIDYVSVAKNYTDYYAIERQVDYVAVPKYETYQEMVPQQRTQYVPQTYTEYVPQTVTDYVSVDRVEEKVDYTPVTRQLVHYPSQDRQFVAEAERSGRIRYGGASVAPVATPVVGGLVGSVGAVGAVGPVVQAAVPAVGPISQRPLEYSQVLNSGLNTRGAWTGAGSKRVGGGINITNERKK